MINGSENVYIFFFNEIWIISFKTISYSYFHKSEYTSMKMISVCIKYFNNIIIWYTYIIIKANEFTFHLQCTMYKVHDFHFLYIMLTWILFAWHQNHWQIKSFKLFVKLQIVYILATLYTFYKVQSVSVTFWIVSKLWGFLVIYTRLILIGVQNS